MRGRKDREVNPRKQYKETEMVWRTERGDKLDSEDITEELETKT